MPTDNISIDSLVITFHDMFYDYFIEPPGASAKDYYVVEVGGVKFGFGSRMQLQKGLTTLHNENPTGVIPANAIMVKPIPKISEPLVRRLGSVVVNRNNPAAANVAKKDSPSEVKPAPEQSTPILKVKEITRSTPGCVFEKGMSPAGITATNISEGQGYDAAASPGVGAWW